MQSDTKLLFNDINYMTWISRELTRHAKEDRGEILVTREKSSFAGAGYHIFQVEVPLGWTSEAEDQLKYVTSQRLVYSNKPAYEGWVGQSIAKLVLARQLTLIA